MVSDEPILGTLTRLLVHPTSPDLLTRWGPLRTNIEWQAQLSCCTYHPFKVWE